MAQLLLDNYDNYKNCLMYFTGIKVYIYLCTFLCVYILLAVACPLDGIHPKVIERGIHIRPYGIERQTPKL